MSVDLEALEKFYAHHGWIHDEPWKELLSEVRALRAERDELKAVRDGMIFLLAEAVKKDTTIAQPSDWSNPHLAVHVWGEPGCAECYELTLQTFLNVASDHSKRIVELSHERDALRAERDAGAKTLAEHRHVLRVHAEERDALRARVAELERLGNSMTATCSPYAAEAWRKAVRG